MAQYAVINEYDRCIKCRGCMVACQRNFINSSLGLSLVANGTADRVTYEDVKVVKSQKNVDFAPFLNYNCWHCSNPPCAAACPFSAIQKKLTGEVVVDFGSCNPIKCLAYSPNPGRYPCNNACNLGGYPKIGLGNGVNRKAYKCDMCYNRRLSIVDTVGSDVVGIDLMVDKCTFGSYNQEVKNAITTNSSSDYKVTACTLACPNGAIKFGYKDDVASYANEKGYAGYLGNGNWYWMGRVGASAPHADPLTEDHLIPLSERLLYSPVGKKLALPALLLAGIYGIYRRRIEVSEGK